MSNYKNDTKLMNMYTEITVYCSTCGHPMLFPAFGSDRKVCKWCGHYVYRNEKTKFQYKVKEEIKKVKEILYERQNYRGFKK